MRKEKQPILYVDDEESNLRIFKTAFKRFYKIHTALSGAEGLEILGENPDINLIITDQKMPKMTGIEFLEKAVEDHPDPIRMILTGFSDVEAIIKAINSGRVYRYITKPWSKDELKITLDKALETYRLKMENKELIVTLKKANESLEQKVKERTRKITDSIRYAQRIQSAILPELPQIRQALPESFVFFKPRDIVSGDFYWFHETENKIIISAIDCTGHGVPGAFMSLIGSDLMNMIVKVREITEPDEILFRMNKEVRAELRQDVNDNRDGMDMTVCVIRKDEKTVEFAGAKNPMAYVNGEGLQIIKGDKYSVGGDRKGGSPTFTKHVIPVENSTMFYMFSDGYQDQFGGNDNRKFMKRRMYNMFEKIAPEPPEYQEEKINLALTNWQGEEKQIDDILIIGFRIS